MSRKFRLLKQTLIIFIVGMSGLINILPLANITQNSSNNNNYFSPIMSSGSSPVLTEPSDVSYYEGDPRDYELSWVVTDLDGGTNPYYIIERNNQFFFQNSWISGDSITIDITDFNAGTYEYNCTVYDGEGNTDTDIAILTVDENYNPSIVNNGSNIAYSAGNTDTHIIRWTITDSAILYTNYSILVNYSQTVEVGSWISGNSIEYDISNLPTGTHTYTLHAIDGYAGESTNTVNVTVGGVTAPEFTSSQSNLIMYEGDPENEYLSWIVEDISVNNPYYIIYMDNQLYQTGFWTSNKPINADISELEDRSMAYFFEIWVYDGTGAFAYESMNLLVHYDGQPSLGNAYKTSSTFIEGTPGTEYCYVYVHDNFYYHPEYQILVDDVIVQNGTWTSGESIYYYYNHLLAGSHHITYKFHDGIGNTYVYDGFDITVNVNNVPSVSHPEDVTFVKGISYSKYVSWSISDSDYYGYYKPIWVYDNETQIYYSSTIWSSSSETYSTYLNNLDIGVHNLTIYAFDGYNKNGTDSVLVTILPNDDIAITPQHENIVYTAGDNRAYSINWTLNDPTIDSSYESYTIYKDGLSQQSGNWADGSEITIDVSGLSVGSYEYRLYAYDGYQKSANDYIQVTVVSNTQPVINSLESYHFVFGDPTNYDIVWTVNDTTMGPTSYTITKNTILYDIGTWDSEISLPSIDLNTLAPGTYTFTIIAYDGCGASVSNSVEVTIDENDTPGITHPNDFSFVEGNPTIDPLTWTIIDATIGTTQYEIIVNGIIQMSSTWASGVPTDDFSINEYPAGTYQIMINATDGYGIFISDNVTLTVDENYAPTVEPLKDLTFTEGDPSSHSFQWIITDAEVGNTIYSIYIDGIYNKSAAWTSGASLSPLDVSNWKADIYTIRIDITDGYGKNCSDEVTLTINANLNPVVNEVEDFYIYQGDPTSLSIDWTISDENVGISTYQIYVNELLNRSGSWSSEDTISVNNIKNWGVGIYNITIEIADGYGGFTTETVIYEMKENILPIITHPSNIEFYEGDPTLYNLTWTITDNSIGITSYTLYIDDVEVNSALWESEIAITPYEIPQYTAGTYVFEIEASDGYGKSVSDTVLVIVYPNNAPTIDNLEDITLVEGDENHHSLIWTLYDGETKETSYNITLNGENFNTGIWTTETPLSPISLSGFVPGEYLFVINATDGYGLNIIDTVLVSVVANTIPTINSPIDLIFLEGDPITHTINWTVSDLTTSTTFYNISINGTTFTTGEWITGIEIEVLDVTNFITGTYVIKIEIEDGCGGTISDSVNVDVLTNQAPEINSPSDINFIEGSEGPHNLSWIITDIAVGTTYYEILVDGQVEQFGSWVSSASTSSFGLDYLEPGIYEIIINATDGLGLYIIDSVNVEIEFNDIPSISLCDDFMFVEGDPTPQYITGTIIDPTVTLSFYNVTLGEELLQWGSWESGEIISSPNLSGWTAGIYEVNVYAEDGYGKYAQDIIIVVVVENEIPAISNHENILYAEGNTDEITINWTIYDVTTGITSYTIFIDGVEQSSGTWNNSQAIPSFNVDGWNVGTYEVQINVSDGFGLTAIDNVTVQVVANTLPIMNNLEDISYIYGDPDNYDLIWMINDTTVGTTWYNISIDGETSRTGAWSSENNLAPFDCSGLSEGTHKILINSTDGAGLWISDEVIVTVYGNTNPMINEIPDIEFVTGNSSVPLLSWTIEDLNIKYPTYIVIIDGVESVSQSWTNNIALNSINISSLSVGNHIIILNATDGYGVYVSDTVNVNVLYNDNPVSNSPANIEYIENDLRPYSINWTIIDPTVDITHYEISINGIEITSGNWISGVSITPFDITNTAAGMYEIEMTATDGYGKIVSDTVILTVLSNTNPIISNLADINYVNGDPSSYSLQWMVTDPNIYNPTYEIFIDGVLTTNGTFTSGVSISSFDISNWAIGTYTIKINITDGYLGTVSDTVMLNVAPNNMPTLNDIEDFTFITGNSTVPTLIWTAHDDTIGLSSYELTINGSTHVSGEWSSDTQIYSLNVANFEIGIYEIMMQIQDGYGNATYQTTTITILENTHPIIIHPMDISYIEGDSDEFYVSWTIIDVNVAIPTYTIKIDENIISTGTWENNVSIDQFDVSSLSFGLHEVIIEATDGYGISVSDVITVNVLFNDNPATTKPANIQYVENDPRSYNLTWTITDPTVDMTSYSISIDGSIITSGIWINEIALDPIDLSNKMPGTYEIVLIASDGYGKSVSDTVILTVSTNIEASINSPADITYVNGDPMSYSIEWTVTDPNLYNPSYEIYLDGELADEGTLTSGIPLPEFNVSYFSVGIYSVLINVTDGYQDQVSDEVMITVIPNTMPSLIGASNYTFISGNSTVPDLKWIANDDTVGQTIYNLTLNGESINTGNWVSDVYMYSLDVSSYEPGVYSFEMMIEDGYGNATSALTLINIIENSAPMITNLANLNYVNGDPENHYLNWTITDDTVATQNYIIEIDDLVVRTGSWNSNIQLEAFNISGWDEGIYVITITALDGYGMSAIDNVVVTVAPNIVPQLTCPSDISYVEGDPSTFELNWVPTDLTTGNAIYYIMMNEIEMDSGNWITGNKIAYDVSGLSIGIYNFALIIMDGYGSTTIDNVQVTILLNSAPVSSHPNNIVFVQGNKTIQELSWIITDDTCGETSYDIIIDGIVASSGTWISNFATTPYNLDNLSGGIHNIKINATDGYGLFTMDEVIVEVIIDLDAPQIEIGNEIVVLPLGYVDEILFWSAIDLYPEWYNLTLDGLLIQENQVWTSNSSIVINIPNALSERDYEYKIIFEDVSGNILEFTTILSIDYSQPNICASMFNNGIFEQYVISWMIYDTNPTTYEIRNDTELVESGYWYNSQAVMYIIPNDLPNGIYNYTITAYDAVGYGTEYTIKVIVDDQVPTMIDMPADQYLKFDYEELILSWTVEDEFPGFYRMMNGLESLTPLTKWNNNEPIEYVVPQCLAEGTYSYTLIIYDGSGNAVSDDINIIVDYTLPSIQLPTALDGDYIYYEDNVQVSVTDENLENCWSYWDDENIALYTESTISTIDLVQGWHTLSINAIDNSGNSQNITYTFYIMHDLENPVINLESPSNNAIINSGTNIRISIVDDSLDTIYYAWDNEDVIYTETSTIITPISSLNGQHNLTIYANDTCKNEIEMTYTFTTDDVMPTISLLSHTNNTEIEIYSNINFNIGDEFGIESVSYKWDDEEENHIITGTEFSIQPNTTGRHVLFVTAVDHAGNEITIEYTFEIVEPFKLPTWAMASIFIAIGASSFIGILYGRKAILNRKKSKFGRSD